MAISDLVTAIAPGCEVAEVGIRPGEKLHEALLSEDEARNAVELDGMFVVKPLHSWWSNSNWTAGRPLAPGFHYTSDSNQQWLSVEDLRELAGETNEHKAVHATA